MASNLDRIKVAEEKLHITIQQAKANFEANLVCTFAFCNDSKIFQYIRNITKSAFIPAEVYLDDSSATLDTDKATLFDRYFYSVFSQNAYFLPAFDDMPPIIDSISITEEEVFNALTSLDSTKATDIDGITMTNPLHYPNI